MKEFSEILKDCFHHIKQITDPHTILEFRKNKILVDDEGYYSFSFGEHKEFELCFEPFGEEGQYYISLYKNRILLLNRIPIWTQEPPKMN